jgi:2'-5' RNA ligase
MSGPVPESSRDQHAARDEQSALLVQVPAAELAVAGYRARLDSSARDGVPAHVTVLYPFLPPTLADDAVLASLGRLFAGFPAFAFALDRVAWFGEDVVWLAPRDPAPFSALIRLASAAFPSCPPYGGEHPEVIPHLTIGHLGSPAELRAAGEAVRRQLPVEATAAEVTLMAGPAAGAPDIPPGQWHVRASFPLGRPSAGMSAR